MLLFFKFFLSPLWVYRNVLTLYGGGGGGDGGAQQMEDQRQERIKAAVDTINGIFNAPGANGETRDALYDKQRQSVLALNSREVDRQQEEAARQNKFALARTGLAGGSADIDSNAEIQRRTAEGAMQAAGLADQAAADLRNSDEQTRSNLISTAQSGIDTGTAAQSALRGLEANSQSAAASRSGATIGNLFDGLSQAYLTNQILSGNKAGSTQNTGGQWFGVSSPQQTYSGK